MRLILLSDTHNLHDDIDVPDGDVLIHAGDLSMQGSLGEIQAFNAWLEALPHPYKVVIAGNHDFGFEREPAAARAALTACTYLQDAEATVAGLRIYGSPWQPWFCDWAFNLQRGAELRAKWALVPDGVDVLVTHGPPAGVGDRLRRGDPVGCADLLDAVQRVEPRLHVFGHIHEGHGLYPTDGTLFVNASICDVSYRTINEPLVVDL